MIRLAFSWCILPKKLQGKGREGGGGNPKEREKERDRFMAIGISARRFLKRGGSNGVEPRPRPRPETNGNETRGRHRHRAAAVGDPRRSKRSLLRKCKRRWTDARARARPDQGPTERPTDQPTDQPTNYPTIQPTNQLTNHPTNASSRRRISSLFASLLTVPTTEGGVKRRREPEWFSTSTSHTTGNNFYLL